MNEIKSVFFKVGSHPKPGSLNFNLNYDAISIDHPTWPQIDKSNLSHLDLV